MSTIPLSMDLPQELARQLDNLADTTGKPKNFLAVQAIQDFIERETWQIAEIKEAIKEADAGDFATESDIKNLDAKWGYSAD